jgi:hypothetical protein
MDVPKMESTEAVVAAADAIDRVAKTIWDRLDAYQKYTCPIKFLSDGTRVLMIFWVDDGEEGLNNVEFGIKVTALGLPGSHVIYNIHTKVAGALTTTFLRDQIVKTQAIAQKSIHKFDGTLGYKKKQEVLAFGGNPVLMGIEECCVCAEETLTKTVCRHAICAPCLLRVDKCPLCRREAFCDCCVAPEDHSDAEFD